MLSKCSMYLTLQRRTSLWLCLEKKDCWGWKCCWGGGIKPVWWNSILWHLGTNKTPYLRREHSEKIHIQKSRKKKQAWFLRNPFCNVGGCVCWWKWIPFCNIKDAMLRTMCGSRTGGWSLPGVMSDWQHCVDWFLAKYCKCRLRLDWSWCRWRTSAKGRRRWGLQVWRRKVGLVRGTRWPAESSAGHMVAWATRWSHGRFLGRASKPRSSRDYVGAESWVAISGGYTEFAGFPVVHQKTTGLLVWSTKPRPKNWIRRCSSIGPIWPVCDDAVQRLRSRGHVSRS
jgi:hypothetical protein